MKMTPGFVFAIIILMLLSCGQKKRISNQIELFKLSQPIYIDTGNLTRKGADQYFMITDDTDSVRVQTYESINELGYIVYPRKVENYSRRLRDNESALAAYALNYFLSRTTRMNPHPTTRGICDFGLWLAVTKDSLSEKHYYLFSCGDVPDSIHRLCESLWDETYHPVTRTNETDKIPTDSLVTWYIDSILQPEVDKLRLNPPPARSSIRFVQPTLTK